MECKVYFFFDWDAYCFTIDFDLTLQNQSNTMVNLKATVNFQNEFMMPQSEGMINCNKRN